MWIAFFHLFDNPCTSNIEESHTAIQKNSNSHVYSTEYCLFNILFFDKVAISISNKNCRFFSTFHITPIKKAQPPEQLRKKHIARSLLPHNLHNYHIRKAFMIEVPEPVFFKSIIGDFIFLRIWAQKGYNTLQYGNYSSVNNVA